MAESLICQLRGIAQDGGLWWQEPQISNNGRQLRWQHGGRKLTLFLAGWGFDCLAQYGDDADEMAYPYDADLSSLWRWIATE